MPDEEKKVAQGIEELAELIPESRTIPVRLAFDAGTTETRDALVVELPIFRLAQMVKIARPMLDSVAEIPELTMLIALHDEEVYSAVAIAIEWEVVDVRRIVGRDFEKILIAIWQVNAFFLQPKLGPLVAFAVAATQMQRNQQIAEAGAAPSPSSSDTVASPIPSASPTDSLTPQ